MAFQRKPVRKGKRPERSSLKPKPPKPAEAGPKTKGGREVDARKTRAALRKLRRAVEESEERAAKDGGDAARLSDWERQFASSVEKKLTTYGSAFRDPAKGRLEEPLSARQTQKLREIGKKAAGKAGGLKRGGGFKPKLPPKRGGRTRDILQIEDDPPPEPKRPKG